MRRLIRLLGTTIGRKLVVAGTGLALLGFVVVHMLGNMTVFQGADALNGYANWLHQHPLLWVARLGLLGVFGIHVVTAISLALENRGARPVGYARKASISATLSSRYIVFSGLLVLAFLVFHLGHFTFGWFGMEGPSVDAKGRADVYAMVTGAFSSTPFTAVYVAAMLLLGFHLHHGVKSVVQTLGINHESYNTLFRVAGRALVATIVAGNCSLPILIWLGVLGAPGGR